jgi:hypothetical protein
VAATRARGNPAGAVVKAGVNPLRLARIERVLRRATTGLTVWEVARRADVPPPVTGALLTGLVRAGAARARLNGEGRAVFTTT